MDKEGEQRPTRQFIHYSYCKVIKNQTTAFIFGEKGRERGREREREGEKERERGRERERERDIERESEREKYRRTRQRRTRQFVHYPYCKVIINQTTAFIFGGKGEGEKESERERKREQCTSYCRASY